MRCLKVLIICFVFLSFVEMEKKGECKSLLDKASNFILINETAGAMRLKAYKDTKPTICNGITYYFFKKKDIVLMEKNSILATSGTPYIISKKNCVKVNNNLFKCDVESRDILTYQQCKYQQSIHIQYFMDVLKKKIGSYYYVLNDNQRIVLLDILFNYGESNDNVNIILSNTIQYLEKPFNYDAIHTLIKSIYNVAEKKWFNTKYNKGQIGRCNRRVSLFFS